jgi:hypothetical protein
VPDEDRHHRLIATGMEQGKAGVAKDAHLGEPDYERGTHQGAADVPAGNRLQIRVRSVALLFFVSTRLQARSARPG